MSKISEAKRVGCGTLLFYAILGIVALAWLGQIGGTLD